MSFVEHRAQSAGSLRRLRRFFRDPITILVEVGGIAVGAALLASVPQAASRDAHARFLAEHPLLARIAGALWLDRVTSSPWFLLLVTCAGVSLSIVVVEQVRRTARELRRPVDEPWFRAAQFRREFSRPEVRHGGEAVRRFATTGRVGLLGSPLFHVGLLLVLIAGGGRALYWSEGFTEIVEGETLPSGPAGYLSHWRGFLAQPFGLRHSFEVVSVTADEGEGEYLGIALSGRYGGQPVQVRVNQPLRDGATTLYVLQRIGPAVLLRWRGDEKATAVLLRRVPGGDGFEGALDRGRGADRLEVRLRKGSERQGVVSARILRGPALVFAGEMKSGEGLHLGDEAALEVLEIRRWTAVQGSRDPFQPFAFAGFAVLTAGILLMYLRIRVDTAVLVTPVPGGELVVVALRAQRFAPLFAHRFERLVREEGGPSR